MKVLAGDGSGQGCSYQGSLECALGENPGRGKLPPGNEP